MAWDIFCRVVDNFGDIGVCWRLAADLAARGETVRLRTDDASALAWMVPAGTGDVRVLPYDDPGFAPGDVVIEAFGCQIPPAFVQRMAAADLRPAWINLEYLSAESFAERAHLLPSPQLSGPGAGMTKWFFYPGFTPNTGGLLREPDLAERQRDFDRLAWLETHAARPLPGEQVVSLFCYEQAALPALLHELAQAHSLLLATPGPASRQVARMLAPGARLGGLRVVHLPALTQRDYDHLTWASDLNFVRGEDSFVRAQWAGKPFVWQIYAQEDGAHLVKLEAFLERFRACGELGRFWRAWNADAPTLPALPPRAEWREACQKWRAELLAQDDLCTQLIDFVRESR